MMPLSKHRWTAADVRALMDASRHWPRYELLDGELLVTNAPTLAHQWAVSELARLLGNYCDQHGVGVALVSPADIELAPDSLMQPEASRLIDQQPAIPARLDACYSDVSRVTQPGRRLLRRIAPAA
jgi:Uma2 family endonuclease